MARHSILFTLVPGSDLNTGGLGYRVRSVTVNNPTGQWWDIDGLPIAPYLTGVVVVLRTATQAPAIRARTPPGFTSSPVAGELGSAIFSDDELPASPGVPFTPSATTISVVSAATTNTGASPLTVALPAGGQTGDIVIFVIYADWNFATAPDVPTVPGFTQRATVAGVTGFPRGQRGVIYSAPWVAGMTITATQGANNWLNAIGAAFILRGLTGTFGAGFSAAAVNAAGTQVVIPAPGLITAGPGVSIYLEGCENNTNAVASITPAATRVVVNNVQIAGTTNVVAFIVTQTGAGSGPAETVLHAGTGFNIMAAGCGVIVS